MIERQEIEGFLNQYVSVGIPHLVYENQLFFHTGQLTELTDEYVKIQTKSGLKLIPLDQIREIRIARRGL